jgi:hypothetical protein
LVQKPERKRKLRRPRRRWDYIKMEYKETGFEIIQGCILFGS